MNKTVLITGGAGFIGSQIAAKLLNVGYKVIIIDNLSTGKKENLPEAAIFYQADLRDFAEIDKVIQTEKPDVISHHAAQAQVRFSVSHPQLDAEINLIGLLNLLESVRKLPAVHFIFASSGGAIYDSRKHQPLSERMLQNPTSPYGVSKLASETYLNMYRQLYGISLTVLRYANVYGPHQSSAGEAGVIALFTQKLLAGTTPLIFGDGSHIRDYVYIDDVVAANVAVIQKKINGTFNIGTQIETSTLEIYHLIAQLLKIDTKPRFVPPQPGEQAYNCLDSSKAFRYFEWRPTTQLKEGITKTIAWQKHEI